MNKLKIVFVCFAALVAVCLAASHQEVQNLDADTENFDVQTLDTEVQIIDDIEAYLAENPDVNLIPLDAEIQPFGQIRYTIGRRVSGDRIVAQGSKSFIYPTLQDVRINLNYPNIGIGSIVSYVEVIVDQTSNDGNVYVASGGIGQRSIRVVIEGRRTLRFVYSAYFYGYN